MLSHKFRVILIFFLFLPVSVVLSNDLMNDLEIRPGDAYIEIAGDGQGLYLYIKASSGLGSVMITESSADPFKQTDSYALRTLEYNPINGDEMRILNGQFLRSEYPLYFLLDSTPENNSLLGQAYKIYIPYRLQYGYPWSRQGQIEIRRGTWLNIRTFARPYADYSGPWRDNPFILSMKEIPAPTPAPPAPARPIIEQKKTAVDNIEQAVERIVEIISDQNVPIDVVLVVDTTVSMRDDLQFVRHALVPLIRSRIRDFKDYRVGMVYYRDYKEAYLTRSIPFTNRLEDIQKNLDHLTANGGRDLQEAVNEGLYAALTEFKWEAPHKIIVQVGDAPPHDKPRGAITREMVDKEAFNLGVSIYPIVLPEKNS